MGSDSSDEPSTYLNRQRKVRIDDGEIESFVRRLSRELARGREFGVVVGPDSAVREANQRFRNKAETTDVLSFPDGEDGRLGDILIAAGRAERQARDFGHSVDQEVKTLILHGLLHLLGFDHETDSGAMKVEEIRLRRRYGLEAGLIERAESC